MWQRFTFYDVRVVAHYLGVLTTFFSLVLVVPFLTALVFQEWEPATRYALTIGIALIVGTGLRLARVEPGKLNYHQALAVVGFAWLFLALIAAIPLALSGHFGSYLDALFDGVSGLTTTGATIVTDLEHLSNADNMWRFSMHAIGGLGLIVIALSLGLFGASTSGLYSAEVSINVETIVHSQIAVVYGNGDPILNPHANPNDSNEEGDLMAVYKNRATVLIKDIVAEFNGLYLDGVGELGLQSLSDLKSGVESSEWNSKSFFGHRITFTMTVSGVSANPMIGY